MAGRRVEAGAGEPDGLPGRQRGIPRHRIHEVCRELAAGDVSQAAIARKWGIARQTLNDFAHRHAERIADIRAHLDDDYAGLWIANKEARIAAYMDEFERLEHGRNSEHHEWSKARQAALRAVADELGAIPNRSSVQVTGIVTHRLIGVDIERAFPPMIEAEAQHE
jgi:hypothetical protein